MRMDNNGNYFRLYVKFRVNDAKSMLKYLVSPLTTK